MCNNSTPWVKRLFKTITKVRWPLRLSKTLKKETWKVWRPFWCTLIIMYTRVHEYTYKRRMHSDIDVATPVCNSNTQQHTQVTVAVTCNTSTLQHSPNFSWTSQMSSHLTLREIMRNSVELRVILFWPKRPRVYMRILYLYKYIYIHICIHTYKCLYMHIHKASMKMRV